MTKKWKISFFGRPEKKLIPEWYLRLGLVLFLGLGIFACKDDNAVGREQYDPARPVTVDNIMPATGGILTAVVIEGDNFGADKTNVQVFFNERQAVVVNVINNLIYALVPKCEDGENEVKVIVGEGNEGILQQVKFDYIVSSKVTTIAAEYTNHFIDNEWEQAMESIDIDDEENLVINCGTKLHLYSIRDNKKAIILEKLFYLNDGCFSRDFQKFYALAQDPEKALVVILNKKNNWAREVIFDSDKIAGDMEECMGIVEDDRGYIFIYGKSRTSGGVIVRIDSESREIKKIGNISLANGRYLAFNPVDKYLYLSLPAGKQIIRMDSRAETLGLSDWEVVVGDINHNYADGKLGEAGFYKPHGICFDEDNNMYVADDMPSSTIRKVDLTAGEMTTIAGKNNNSGYADGDAAGSKFYNPIDVASTRDGIVYVMEYRVPTFTGDVSVQRLRCVAIQ